MRTDVTLSLPKDITALVDHIATRFRPAQIILFGSHAAGTADDGSDVDLLVVTETGGRPLRRAAEIYRSLDHRLPIDILVRSPEQMAKPNPRDIILREIQSTGVIVYTSSDSHGSPLVLADSVPSSRSGTNQTDPE